MTKQQFHGEAVTEDQREAFRSLQERSGIEFDELLARSHAPTPLTPYIGVNDFHGMFVGIEPDGFTHS